MVSSRCLSKKHKRGYSYKHRKSSRGHVHSCRTCQKLSKTSKRHNAVTHNNLHGGGPDAGAAVDAGAGAGAGAGAAVGAGAGAGAGAAVGAGAGAGAGAALGPARVYKRKRILTAEEYAEADEKRKADDNARAIEAARAKEEREAEYYRQETANRHARLRTQSEHFDAQQEGEAYNEQRRVQQQQIGSSFKNPVRISNPDLPVWENHLIVRDADYLRTKLIPRLVLITNLPADYLKTMIIKILAYHCVGNTQIRDGYITQSVAEMFDEEPDVNQGMYVTLAAAFEFVPVYPSSNGMTLYFTNLLKGFLLYSQAKVKFNTATLLQTQFNVSPDAVVMIDLFCTNDKSGNILMTEALYKLRFAKHYKLAILQAVPKSTEETALVSFLQYYRLYGFEVAHPSIDDWLVGIRVEELPTIMFQNLEARIGVGDNTNMGSRTRASVRVPLIDDL